MYNTGIIKDTTSKPPARFPISLINSIKKISIVLHGPDLKFQNKSQVQQSHPIEVLNFLLRKFTSIMPLIMIEILKFNFNGQLFFIHAQNDLRPLFSCCQVAADLVHCDC